MKYEFETLAGRTVTDEQYMMIESLYMASNLDKYDFVKSIKGMLKSIPEKIERKIITVLWRDNSGYFHTPNGCWLHTIKAELIDVDIKTGKILARKIPNSYELGYSFDIDYTALTFVD